METIATLRFAQYRIEQIRSIMKNERSADLLNKERWKINPQIFRAYEGVRSFDLLSFIPSAEHIMLHMLLSKC